MMPPDSPEAGNAPSAHHLMDQAQRRLIAIIENTTDFISMALPDGMVIYINRAGRRLVGLRENDLLASRHIQDFHPPEVAASVLEVALPAALRDGTWSGEATLRALDGRLIPVSQVIIAHHDDHGRPSHFSTIARDLTAQKQAEAALIASWSQLQLAQHIAHLGSWELSHPDNRLIWSEEIYRIFELDPMRFGASYEAFLGFVHPGDRQKVDEAFTQAVRDRKPYETTHRLLLAGGRIKWVHERGNTVYNTDGKPVRTIGTVQDITSRIKAMEALRESRNRLGSLIHSVDGIVWEVEVTTFRFTFVSEQAERILGYPAAMWLEDPEFWSKHLHPEDRDAAVAYCRESTARMQDHQFEYRMLAADGREVWLKDIVTVLVENGRPAKLRGIMVDITAQRRAERERRESETRYRILFDGNPQPMWVYDTETLRILTVNEAAVAHYGYTREEFLGLTIKQLCPLGDPACDDGPAGGNPCHTTGERHHCRKDGSVLIVEVYSHPLNFADRPTVLVIANDITEKKRLEEKFLRAQRLENLGLLAAGIAHDLNNVLSPVLMGATLLRLRATNPADVPILETLEKSATRGANLVRQILSFARGAGENALIQPKHLLRDIAELIEETFPKSIQFDAAIPKDLWTIHCSPTQFHQILLNLCINARDAMPHGGTLHLSASNRRFSLVTDSTPAGIQPGPYVVIEVGDTGSGIPPEIIERIWEPFFTTKGEKGTGLGLSTVRGIVHDHGGTITVDSRIGHGSTFRIYLPAADASAEPSTTPLHTPPLPVGRGELVLVVDDETDIRNLVATVLTQHGYRVLLAANGTEALTLFTPRATEIPLVISDIRMPELDGPALAHALPRFNSAVKILFITGAPSIQKGGSLPPHMPLLTKPFSPTELLTQVDHLLHPAPAASN